MRNFILSCALAACLAPSAFAEVNVSIGINVPAYPDLQPIPGYPVYYAPRLSANYFFYDGLYWVYGPDGWYTSDWYDGPWQWVGPDQVPLFVLRIPVRYYLSPPPVFRSWAVNTAPRWDAVWGADWSHRHHNWSQWNHASAPALAPLPRYQRDYDKSRYPDAAQRHQLLGGQDVLQDYEHAGSRVRRG